MTDKDNRSGQNNCTIFLMKNKLFLEKGIS